MARTKQTARKSTAGPAPEWLRRNILNARRYSGGEEDDEEDDEEDHEESDEGNNEEDAEQDELGDNVSVGSIDRSLADASEDLNRDEDFLTVAPAFTDSGYRSLDKKEEAQREVDFSDTDSVRSDNRDSGLTFDVKRRLASEFARELTDNLSLPATETTEAIAQIVSVLPDLLQQYAVIAHHEARPGIQQRAAVFVRHQRK